MPDVIAHPKKGTVEIPADVYEALRAYHQGRVLVPERLTDYRKRNGLKIGEFSEAIGYSCVSAIERRGTQPSSPVMDRLQVVYPKAKFVVELPELTPPKNQNPCIDVDKLARHLKRKYPEYTREELCELTGLAMTQLFKILAGRYRDFKPVTAGKVFRNLGLVPEHYIVGVVLPEKMTPECVDIQETAARKGITIFQEFTANMPGVVDDLTRALGLSTQIIRYYQSGKSFPLLSNYLKICEYYGLPFYYFEQDWLNYDSH